MSEISDSQQELIECIKKKQWNKVEEIWLRIVETPPDDLGYYKGLAGTISRNGGTKKLPVLWEVLVTQFIEKQDYLRALDLIRIVLELNPDAPNLHPAALESVKAINKDCPRLEMYIRESGFADPEKLALTLRRCEEFLAFDEGRIFQHINWGVGVVTALDIPREKVTIDFPKLKNKVFTFEGARQYLKPLDPGHFYSLEEINPDALRDMAQNDPIELVKLIIRSLGRPVSQPELKTMLAVRIIPANNFSSWWNKIKQGLRSDPWIELGTGTRPELRLRSEAKGFYEEMLERFQKAHTFEQRRKILKEIADHRKGEPLPVEKASHFASFIRKWHSTCKPEEVAERLRLIYLMDEVAELMSMKPAPLEEKGDASILNGIESISPLLHELDIFDYQCTALKSFINLHPEPKSRLTIIQDVFLDGPAKISQFAFDLLLQNKEYDEASRLVGVLLDDFDRNPETYAWCVTNLLKNKWQNVDCMHSDLSLLEMALHHLERTRQKYDPASTSAKANRDIQGQLRALFTGDHFSILERVIAELDVQDVKHLHNSINASPAFLGAVKDNIENVFRKVRKDAFVEEASDSLAKIHYCTAEMLKIKQDELRRIKTVEIPRNTKEIEVARAHGDLSENAEYEAAKMRQGLLFKQMQELQELIVRARIINPKSVSTSQVNIGTRCVVRNFVTGADESYSILGLWEAKPEKHIVSYMSPL
ncbi:MAG TPA: hypothetical protein PLB62_03000, partial [Candidatus Sumerlaeota bacterium]|nr:hypothetical protein [Candidatus Sumerlaeota bacterium]